MSVALVQAATALDIAAEYGVESKNPEVMLQVAALWIDMGRTLSGPDEEEGEEDDVTSSVPSLGFGPNPVKEVAANGK